MILFEYITLLRLYSDKIGDFVFTSFGRSGLYTILAAYYVIRVEPAFDGATI